MELDRKSTTWRVWPATPRGRASLVLLAVAGVLLTVLHDGLGVPIVAGALVALAAAVLGLVAIVRGGDRSSVGATAVALGLWVSLPYLVGSLLGFE